MKTVVLEEPGKLEMVERERPTVHPGEALVKIWAGGICGSDLSAFRGKNPMVRYPRVLGHELCGEVVALGGVDSALKVDDRVVVDPMGTCGRCYPCRLGRSNCCVRIEVMGVQRDGGFAEYVALPFSKLYKVPEGVSSEEAALCEPFAVSAQANARGEVGAGEKVVVIGAGTIGLAALQIAKVRGALVTIVDQVDRKLNLAEELGADETVHVDRQDVEAEVRRFTDGEGAHVVIEAVGAQETVRQAIEIAASAGRVVIVGLAYGDLSFSAATFFRKELDLRGSRNSYEKFPEVLQMLSEGKITPGRCITHRFPFSEAETALRFMDAHPEHVTKIMLEGW